MRKLLFSLIIFFVLTNTLNGQFRTENGLEVFYIDDFEGQEIGELPKNWMNQRGTGEPYTYDEDLKNTYKYKVLEEEGNKFLRFDGTRGKHLNFPLLEIEGLSLERMPILKWDWRAHKLPKGGNEGSDDKNDVVSSIYVVFDMGRVALVKKVPKSIRYTWSSTLEEGTEISTFFGNQKIVVVESGEQNIGKWKSFERNILEDYRRLFGENPPDVPIALLILSDGNDTQAGVVGDYDNIRLSIDK